MHEEKDVSPVGTTLKLKKELQRKCSYKDPEAIFSSEADKDLDPDPAPDPAFSGQIMTPL
jgi:hypothetical protein